MSPVSKLLLNVLVCPVDKGRLIEIEKEKLLECQKCKRKFPVKNGIPIMLAKNSLPANSSN